MDNENNVSGKDLVLNKLESCWVTVENLSVYIRAGDEGVSVSLYPLGKEDEQSITETWALYHEGEEE
jgi:hypothetical protein